MKARLSTLIALLVSLASTGCLAVEKKTLVLVVPTESKEIHAYELFEGISVPDDKQSKLDLAKGQIDALKNPGFSFFAIPLEKESPFLKVCAFEPTRFFIHPDPAARRLLCMDRRFTITDRDAFAKRLNRAISEKLTESFQEHSEADFIKELKKGRAELAKSKAEDPFQMSGVGPMLNAMAGLLDLADGFDLASVQKLKASAKDGFRWVRIDAGQIHIVFPTTPEYAKRVVISPKAKDWLKDMRSFVDPIDLAISKDGLAIVLGKQGQPIRFTHEDLRPARTVDDNALAAHAGAAGPIVIDGKAMTGPLLLERFLAEKKQSK